MDKQYEQVKAFHAAFNHPIAPVPAFMGQLRAEARAKWMMEEIQEFLDAAKEQPIDGILAAQADAMIDLIYFALGTLVEIGVPPERMFEIVQQANMAKLHADGKPRHREDGKVIKPEGWQAPEPQIAAYIEQLRHASKTT